MASEEPRKPESIHKKNSVAVSVRTIGKGAEDEESNNEDTKKGFELQPLDTNLGKRTKATEILPKPTNDPNDPLVCASLYSWRQRSNLYRIGQSGRKNLLSPRFFCPLQQQLYSRQYSCRPTVLFRHNSMFLTLRPRHSQVSPSLSEHSLDLEVQYWAGWSEKECYMSSLVFWHWRVVCGACILKEVMAGCWQAGVSKA